MIPAGVIDIVEATDPLQRRTSRKEKNFVIAGSVLTGVGVALLAVVPIVQAIGFGVGGIVAGSTAASMMSAQAIATGAIATGSKVAVLQSIGATGMVGSIPIAGQVILGLSLVCLASYGIYKIYQAYTTLPTMSKLPKSKNFPYRRIGIKAPNGKFLRAVGGGKGNKLFDLLSKVWWKGNLFQVKAEATRIYLWETFTVHPCEGVGGEDYFALQSHHNAYLSVVHGGSEVKADQVKDKEEVITIFEKFRFVIQVDNPLSSHEVRNRNNPYDPNDPNIRKGYFKSHDGYYLTIDHQTNHLTADAHVEERAALFEICEVAPPELPPVKKIAIKAPNGKFLTSLGGGRGNKLFDWLQYTGVVKAEKDRVLGWEKFTIHEFEEGYYSLQSHHGAYLQVQSELGDEVRAEAAYESLSDLRPCAKFRFIATGVVVAENESMAHSKVSILEGYIQAHNGTYCTIKHSHSHLIANAKEIEHASVFQMHVF